MDKIEQAQVNIAGSIGMDIINIQSPDDPRHFDPATLLFAFAGMLIVSFAKGFIEEARARSVDGGKLVADKLFDSGKNLLNKHPDQQKEEVTKAVDEMKAVKSKITGEEIQQVTNTSQIIVENVLLKNNFSPDKAAELAQQVTNETLKSVI